MAKLFFDDVHVIDGIPENPPDDGYALTFISLSDGEINARCVAADYGITCEGIHSERADRETPERVLGKAMFSAMEKLTGRRPPWGILTGVRPVRLVAEHSGFFQINGNFDVVFAPLPALGDGKRQDIRFFKIFGDFCIGTLRHDFLNFRRRQVQLPQQLGRGGKKRKERQ